MATTGPFNGTSLTVYVAGTAIALSKSCTLNRNNSMIDTTTKDSAGDKDGIPGLRDWSVSVDGLVGLDETTNIAYLDGLLTGRTLVSLKFSTNTSGDTYWTGNAYITTVSVESPMEAEVSFSAAFEGTGPLALVTLT